MDNKFLQKGLSVIEVLVSFSIIATAIVLVATSAVTTSAATQKSDVTSFFDNRNFNATAAFKTNPDIEFLKTQIPFDEMEYDEDTMTFTQGFDKKLQKVGPEDSSVIYKSEYKIKITDASNGDFRFENKEIKLDLFNYAKDEGSSQFKLLNNSASKGSVTIHTNYLKESSVNPNPSEPSKPSKPESGDKEYYYLTFKLSGGKFKETGSDVLVKMIPAGMKYGDKIEVDTDTWKAILPEENNDFTKKDGYDAKFSGWEYSDGRGSVSSGHIVNEDKTLIGSYSEIKNEIIGIEAIIKGRDYWDISNSFLNFFEKNGKLYMKVSEGSSMAGTQPYDTESRSIDLGPINGYRAQIKNKNALQSINLNLKYDYVNVKAFFDKNMKLSLSYNGAAATQAMSKLYDGSGAKFTISEKALTDLGKLLGMQNGVIHINVNYIRNEVDRTVLKDIVVGNFACYINLDGVNKANRIDNEKYRIKLVKNPNKDSQGRTTYQIQLLGENGDNIMHPDYEGGKEWGNALYLTKNLYFGEDIGRIDNFSFLSWGNNFTLQFADPVTAEGSDLQVEHAAFVDSKDFPTLQTKPTGSGNGGYLQMYGSVKDDVVYHFEWLRGVHGNDHNSFVPTSLSQHEIEVGIALPNGFGVMDK